MRDYEVVFIIQSDLDDTARTGIVERVSSWITDAGGSIVKKDDWGKRRLAYSIRKQREGHYVLLHAQMEPAFVTLWNVIFSSSSRFYALWLSMVTDQQ
jgi:small subunit ribosomal protein S6